MKTWRRKNENKLKNENWKNQKKRRENVRNKYDIDQKKEKEIRRR